MSAATFLPLRTARVSEHRRRSGELNGHLMTCALGCTVYAIACPEGERLAERVAQAGTAVHDARRGWG